MLTIEEIDTLKLKLTATHMSRKEFAKKIKLGQSSLSLMLKTGYTKQSVIKTVRKYINE